MFITSLEPSTRMFLNVGSRAGSSLPFGSNIKLRPSVGTSFASQPFISSRVTSQASRLTETTRAIVNGLGSRVMLTGPRTFTRWASLVCTNVPPGAVR